jgi:hypothetical protein
LGLFIDRIRFVSPPPSDDVLLGELARRTGSAYGVDSIERTGTELQVCTMLDPVTRPYLLQILMEHGGVPLDYRSGEPRAVELPAYVAVPWRKQPLWKRTWIRILFLVGLLGTALPSRTKER